MVWLEFLPIFFFFPFFHTQSFTHLLGDRVWNGGGCGKYAMIGNVMMAKGVILMMIDDFHIFL